MVKSTWIIEMLGYRSGLFKIQDSRFKIQDSRFKIQDRLGGMSTWIIEVLGFRSVFLRCFSLELGF